MIGASGSSHRLPEIDATETIKRKKLEAELICVDAQLRKFGQLREWLTATGREPAAYFRNLQGRRKRLAATLNPHREATAAQHVIASESPGAWDVSSWTPALEPQRVVPTTSSYLPFVSAGTVQVQPASECLNLIEAYGPGPQTGEIELRPAFPGRLEFDGFLKAGPDSADVDNPDEADTTLDYVWLRSWKYLVPFPMPPVNSTFTYSFDVEAVANVLFSAYGAGMVLSFVTLGEAPALGTGMTIVVDKDGGWPLSADLTQPSERYQNGYGSLDGWSSVRRSFLVQAGRAPGVAIVVGFVVLLSTIAFVRLANGTSGHSSITLGSFPSIGTIKYLFTPKLSAQQ